MAAPIHRIPDFLRRLDAIGRNNASELWGVCMAEKRVLKGYGYSIGALKRTLTDYRKAITARFGASAPALPFMRLSLEDMEELRDGYRATVTTAHGQLRPIGMDAFLETAEAVLSQGDSQHPMRLAAALLFVTGRRTVELFLAGTFRPSPKRRTLVFDGQAKTRGAASAQLEPYEIPVLADPRLVLNAIAQLRRRLDEEPEPGRGRPRNTADPRDDDATAARKLVNGRYSKVIGTFSAELFRDGDDAYLTPKDLRAAYATVAYVKYAPATVSMNAYFSRILGHSPLDLITSLSYVKFYPIGEKRAFASDVRWAIDAAIALQEDALEKATDDTTRGYIRERVTQLQAAAAALTPPAARKGKR